MLVGAVLVPLITATVIGLVALWPSAEQVGELPEFASGRAQGTVLDVRPCGHDVPGCLVATVDITGGIGAGRTEVAALPFGEQAPTISPGDEILLSYVEEAPPTERYAFQDFDRTQPLLLLLTLFVLGVLVLSRWRGVGSLASLALSLALLVTFTLPALMEGRSPLVVAIVTASAIMCATLYLSHGFSTRTSIAMAGTLLSLVFIGLLGSLFTRLGQFTGLGDEGSRYIATINTQVDVGGLLLAGLVIGALGVLDDVTVTQVAAVWELADADPHTSRTSLFTRGMRIGRSHVASTVNTLVLAYVGATLPLLLVFSTIALPFGTAVSQELVAQEIVRGLVGGLGIVLAVPITTGLAAIVAGQLVAGRRRDAPAGRGVGAPTRP